MTDRQIELFTENEETSTDEITPAMDWDAIIDEQSAAISVMLGPRTCLCGSTRFLATFLIMNAALTKRGIVTHSIACRIAKKAKDANMGAGELGNLLDRVHLKKIVLSDSILVLDVGGYVGESTLSEIQYAKSQRKHIHYLSKMCNWREPDLDWALDYAYGIRLADSHAAIEG